MLKVVHDARRRQCQQRRGRWFAAGPDRPRRRSADAGRGVTGRGRRLRRGRGRGARRRRSPPGGPQRLPPDAGGNHRGWCGADSPAAGQRQANPATGERRWFASAILPAWARKSPQVAEVLPLLYLHGLSSNDFAPALGSSSSARRSGCLIRGRCPLRERHPGRTTRRGIAR